MIVQRTLLVASVLILLYLGVMQALTIAFYDPSNVFHSPMIAAIILAHALSMALFLVTSYRQIQVRRPRMLVLCIIMLIISNFLIMLSLYFFQQDTAAQAWHEQMNKAMIDALENSNIAGGSSDVLKAEALETPTYMDVVKALGFSLLLLIIPAYVNFRPRLRSD